MSCLKVRVLKSEQQHYFFLTQTKDVEKIFKIETKNWQFLLLLTYNLKLYRKLYSQLKEILSVMN